MHEVLSWPWLLDHVHQVIDLPWLPLAVAIIFFSAMVQGLTGFASGLISVGILLHFVDPTVAVPCLSVAALGIISAILVKYHNSLDLQLILWAGLPLLVLTPAGAWLLKIVPSDVLQIGVGGILIAVSAEFMMRTTSAKAKPETSGEANGAAGRTFSKPTMFALGGMSGVLGGATAMPGPLLAAYLIRIGASRETFKMTLNVIFLGSTLARMGAYAYEGMLPWPVLGAGLVLAPVGWLGTVLGYKLDRFVPAKKFVLGINCFLLALGAWLMYTGCTTPAAPATPS